MRLNNAPFSSIHSTKAINYLIDTNPEWEELCRDEAELKKKSQPSDFEQLKLNYIANRKNFLIKGALWMVI